MDYIKVKLMNDHGEVISQKLRKALNTFFNLYPDCASGCIIRKNFDNADYALIIEESDLYYHLQGEYGWSIHTAFHKAFDGTGFFPEMHNSCVVGFYKD